MEKFEDELEKVSTKINNMKLSEEFKENLCKRLDYEYSRIPEKKRFFIPTQIVAVFFCCILLTSYAFADGLGDLVTNIFSNTAREFHQAAENGELQTINMDYIEKDGVSIKVDYAIINDDGVCIAFNVLSKEEFNKIFVGDLWIRNEYNEDIFSIKEKNNPDVNISYSLKKVNKNNAMYILKFSNLKFNNNEMRIILDSIRIKGSNNIKNINDKWEFNINI